MIHWRYWTAMSALYGVIGFATLALALNRALTAAHAAGASWLLWRGRIPARLPLIEGATPVELVPEDEPEVRSHWRFAGLLKGVALILLLLVLSDSINGQGGDFAESFVLALAAGALPLLMTVISALDRVPRRRPLE